MGRSRLRTNSGLGPGVSKGCLVLFGYGACLIRPASKTVLRSLMLSVAIGCAGLSAPAVFAQSAPVTAAGKAATLKSSPAKSAPAKATPSQAPDEVAPGQPVSDMVIDLAGWVIATADNRGLPFAVIDKYAAQILIFDTNGKLKGMAPVLVGSATGDASAAGVGDRELKDIPMADRTTPAGRFLAGYGPAVGGDRVLWIDYATSVSIHPMPTTSASKKEKRKERLASPQPDDNRITHGCINVSSTFYKKVVSAVFKKKGGIFYVLPDTMSAQEAFPGFEPPVRIATIPNVATPAR